MAMGDKEETSLEELLESLEEASGKQEHITYVQEQEVGTSSNATVIGGQVVTIMPNMEVAENTTIMSVSEEKASSVGNVISGMVVSGPGETSVSDGVRTTTITLSLPDAPSGSQHQQILIPIDLAQANQLQTGNTVLLPVIPTLMPDGQIEMRVATGSLQGLQIQGAQPTPIQPKKKTRRKKGDVEETLVEMAREDAKKGGEEDESGPRVYACQLCDYSNTKRYLLLRHMKSHSEERPHACTVCEASFKTASSLNNHLNTHTGVKPFKCRDCEMAFTTSGEMVRHARYRHTREKPHACPHCSYATVELSKLKRHIRSHTGERPFKCPLCPYSSPDTYKLKRHQRTHTGEKPYECPTCSARFTQSNSLKAHQLTHDPDSKPVFKCPHCPTTCGRKTDLRIHVVKLHQAGKDPLPCPKCELSFPDRYTLKQHSKSHEGIGGRSFACGDCDHVALTKAALALHSRSPPIPTLLLPDRYTLKQHSKSHEGIGGRSFACGDCDHVALTKAALALHSRQAHDSPDVMVCPQCPKEFRSRALLRRHLLVLHSASPKAHPLNPPPPTPKDLGLTDLSSVKRVLTITRPPRKTTVGKERLPERDSKRSKQINREVASAFGFGMEDDETEEPEM